MQGWHSLALRRAGCTDPRGPGRRAPAVAVAGALAGQSLNEFLLARLTELAALPTVPELAARIRTRAAYVGPSSASAVREARDSR
jgi:hypothetical protein